MQRPIAFKLDSSVGAQVYRVRAEPIDTATLNNVYNGPAIVIARTATVLNELTTGIVDADEIILAQDGDWNSALLIVVGDAFAAPRKMDTPIQSGANKGDEAFMDALTKSAPHLVALGREVIDRVRLVGVTGELVEKSNGRWVNSPVNSFTLKAQPRAKNIQFTLYGEPKNYDAGEFLLKDQNSYSRGWVKDAADAKQFASFARQAHTRRER